MADKQGSSCGLYILTFFTFLNFAALICISVYHFQYEHNQDGLKAFSVNDALKHVLDDLKQGLNPNEKRSVDDVYSQLHHYVTEQKSSLVEECVRDVVKTIAKSEYVLQKHGNSRTRRQTGSTGNDLANIFGEIAKSEVSILAKYCNNGSFVCMPGQKGEPGVRGLEGPLGHEGPQGIKGSQGALGPQGPKGDMGSMGPAGPKGDNGTSGMDGVKGEKGDMGASGPPGASITGPPGPKGSKGDPGSSRALTSTTQCCSSLTVPKFSQQIETIRALEGTDFTLNCNASGYPSPSIVWTPSSSTMDVTRTVVSPNKVTVKNSKTSDGHMYTCTAQNALGNSVKQFMVHVYKHIKFDEVPLNYTVMVAKPVTLECMIEGPLTPHIVWYKVMPDGSKFLLTNNITPIVNGSQLHIDHVNSADTGEYICEGNNGIETVQKKAYIHTYGPPHIVPPGTVHATAGQNVVLRCDTDSYPASNITWKYPPGVTNAYKETDGTLMVLNAKPKDATYFICIAKNVYGTDQATLNLKIDVPPKVIVTPDKVDMSSGVTNLAIECKASGEQPLKVQWAKDGTPITTKCAAYQPGGQGRHRKIHVYSNQQLGSAQGSAIVYNGIGTVNCTATFSACSSDVCGVTCPANCAGTSAPVYGYQTYHKASSICRAGIQSGAITNASGGTVTWTTANNVSTFTATTHNGITSQPHAAASGNVAAVIE